MSEILSSLRSLRSKCACSRLISFLGWLLLLNISYVLGQEGSYFQVDADLLSRIRFDRSGSTFQLGRSSFVDSGKINFLTHYQTDDLNMDAMVGFEFNNKNTNTIYQPQFSEAYLRVNNLFGIMDLKFFDIGYGAGEGNAIRPDLPVRGMQIYLRPIPELTLSLGYGIASTGLELYPVSNSSVQTSLQGEGTSYAPNYHALKLDIIYDNLHLPIGIYYGIILIDNNSSYLAKGYLPTAIQDSILHTSAGFSLDILNYFRKGAMQFDAGFGMPLGTMSRYIDLGENGDHSYDPEFNFLFQFYGDVDIFFGLGLKYKVFFALDTHTKQKVFGNLYDEYFKETFKLFFVPRYTYGPVSVDLGIDFSIVGEKAAGVGVSRANSTIYNYQGTYNNLVLESGLSWTPFPHLGRDLMVRGYYQVDFGDLENSSELYHQIGLQLSLSFNSLGID